MPIHDLFAYICVRNAADAIAFYTRAFGAAESFRLTDPKGRIGHAEITFGSHVVMLSEEYPEYGVLAPAQGVKLPFVIHLHVDDADRVIEQAVAAGATIVRPAKDEFYGERSGRIRDPFGYEWLVGHQIEEVSHEEMQRRFTALCG